MYIYLNGEIVKETEAKISPFDYGYLYGIGFFETFRIYDGHPFLLEDHLERINNALCETNVHHRFEKSDVLPILDELLEQNAWQNASIRLNVSAGAGKPGLQSLTFHNPTILVYGGPLPEADHTLKSKDARILSVKRNSPEGSERWKSHHFMNNLIAKQELNDHGIEGIFLTSEGYVAEGITSNIFWVKRNTVFTPTTETGILNGITRQYVLTLCEKLEIPVQIGRFTQNDLMQADEIFITNSVQEITAVRSLDGITFKGTESEITARLFREYADDRHVRWTRRT